jgi:hypothetical protein
MPVGFEAYDANGKLQFNDSMFCYFLRKTGSGTTTESTIGNTDPSKIELPATGYTNPIIAIQCAAAVSFYGLFGGNYYWLCSGAAGTSFNYFVYDRSSTIPASNFGLEVVDANGAITFSSNYRPMQVLSLLNSVTYPYWGGPEPGTNQQSVTYTGRSLAVAQGETGGHRLAGPIYYWFQGMAVVEPPYDATSYQNDAKIYGATVSNSNQTATVDWVSFDDVYIGPEPGDVYVPPDWQRQPLIFVCDVTGVPIGTTFF